MSGARQSGMDNDWVEVDEDLTEQQGLLPHEFSSGESALEPLPPAAQPPASRALSSEDAHLTPTLARTGPCSAKLMLTLGLTQQAEAEKEALPADIVVVVDVSGSMGTEATLQTDGGTESAGLSVLDVVKHAVRTVISTLRENDRFALVTFHSVASTAYPLGYMTTEGKEAANRVVESLVPLTTTNLWDGLHTGMELLRHTCEQASTAEGVRNRSLMLLTDGVPNVEPPRGHLPMMKQYKDAYGMQARVSTFGFGYNLDSHLLNALAEEGDGSFAFIPDSSFVGTIFVNATANHRALGATAAALAVGSAHPRVKITGVQGPYAWTPASWGGSLHLGTLQRDVDRRIVVDVALDGPVSDAELCGAFDLSLTYTSCSDPSIGLPSQGRTVKLPGSPLRSVADEQSASRDARLAYESARARLAGVLRAIVTGGSGASTFSGSTEPFQAQVQALAGEVQAALAAVTAAAAPVGSDAAEAALSLRALAEDVAGQVTEAVSRAEWLQRWGQHYLRSLGRTHLLEESNNFKDPGVQHFGGPLFRRLRDQADSAFLKLAPPKPSVRAASGRGGRSCSRSAAPVNMAMFYSRGNPCFAGDSLVEMADGSTKAVAEVRRGDLVQAGCEGAPRPARVRFVVRTLSADRHGLTELVQLPGGLRVTPYHPVWLAGKWQFPRDVAAPQMQRCRAVYSFAVEGGHSAMTINGVQCATLGHGREDDPVLAHPFFGSMQRLEADLGRMDGWDAGMVQLLADRCIVRDHATGLICGLRQVSAAELAGAAAREEAPEVTLNAGGSESESSGGGAWGRVAARLVSSRRQGGGAELGGDAGEAAAGGDVAGVRNRSLADLAELLMRTRRDCGGEFSGPARMWRRMAAGLVA